MKLKIHLPLFVLMAMSLTACQSPQKLSPTPTPVATSQSIAFAITGKIGMTTMTVQGKQAGSAFYGWRQEGERFAIDLTGVLGMGATQIRYDGRSATVTNDSGVLTANSPEELLTKATGWHAPISQLPHWIMGRPAPNDTDSAFDGEQLRQSTNGDWTATFEYKNTLPNRLTITHTDGHRVVMTITHE